MTIPWIEIEQHQDQDDLTGPPPTDYTWQAMFACQAGIRPHPDWAKMKWGFNAQALFDEALERQRLFLQSQHEVKTEMGMERMESPDHRTLAFRFIARPGEGLLFAVLAKIHGRTQEEVHQKALAYYRELKSTFPYDHTLVPANTRDAFIRFTGGEILENLDTLELGQIKRLETPVHPGRDLPFLQGLWHAGPRTHEQIWRFLAASPQPLLLNISIRSAFLYEGERQEILQIANKVEALADEIGNRLAFSGVKEWNKTYKERRLAPWRKFFFLQVILASSQRLDDNIYRVVGTSLCSNPEGKTSPGFRVVNPHEQEKGTWQKRVRNLDFVRTNSFLAAPRLAEIADMEEVYAVMRIPYAPPEKGFPEMKFAEPRNDRGEHEG